MLTETAGGYAFVAGSDPYSEGVVATAEYEIVHATLAAPMPWLRAFRDITGFLASHGRPLSALCGIELRSPEAMSFDGFLQFNEGYQAVLIEENLLVSRMNPLARTNVVPDFAAPGEVVMHAFSFTIESKESRPTFVTSGAGELVSNALDRGSIVRRGETDPAALREKAAYVMETMSARLERLGVGWGHATAVDLYTRHDPGDLVRTEVAPRIGSALRYGVVWYPSSPPITGLEYEMDVRGVRRELVVDLDDA